MRLQAAGDVLAAWVGVLPGSGILAEGTVLGLRTFALAEDAELDVLVPLGAVADRTAHATSAADLRVPPTRALAPWSALTPPRGPWEPVGALPGDLLGERGARRARRGRRLPCASGAPPPASCGTGCGHATSARRPGPHPDLLTPDGVLTDGDRGARRRGVRGLRPRLPRAGQPVQVLRSNRWTRLTAPGGHVVLR